MKHFTSKALFFISALSYFIATAIGIDNLAGDSFRLVGVFSLLIGVLVHFREKRKKLSSSSSRLKNEK